MAAGLGPLAIAPVGSKVLYQHAALGADSVEPATGLSAFMLFLIVHVRASWSVHTRRSGILVSSSHHFTTSA